MSRTKRVSQIAMILIIGFAFGSGIASAEYLGPDRVHTIIISEACEYGVWAHKAGYHECLESDGITWAAACIDCGWECDPGSACGGAEYYYSLGTRLVEHSVTTTDPEATVAITPNCGAWGDASWCLQPSSVTITANEPVSGEQITLIEGTQNGDAFACQANTCTVNVMGEGSNALTYWALSSYGDSSRMGTHTALQDTIAPEINASVTGTMGDNGWFVSNATLCVAFTDTLPGSGISSSSALFNGILTDVSSPVTITEGLYNIQLDTRDAANRTASASQTISVDTTAPAVTANQPPIEVANSNVTGGGYVNGSVVFTGTCSDATSGVDRIEISTDGKTLTSIAPNADGTWTLDWDSSMLSDGTYTPVITAVDAAGNRTEITMQPLTLDNSAPAMSMTGAWYIWDSGHIEVFDSRVGIEHIELSVRDGQNRWPAREWDYDTSKLVMDLQWDRKFGDGTVAPTGDYEVLLQAWDRLGNGRYITSRIYIPEAGATAVIPLGDVVSGGTFEDTPTPMVEQTQTEENTVVPAAPAATEEAPPPTPEPSSTPSSLTFSSPPVISASGESKSTSLPVDPNLLTGAAALAAAASATAYSLQRKEEKAAERKRQEEQSRAEAMAIVRAAEATKIANYLKKLENDEKEKWLKDLRDTEGKVYNDLTDEEKETLKYTNVGAARAVSEYYGEVYEQNAELSRLIASTGGRAISDLSKEQFNELLDQGLGAKMAASSYITAQQAAYEAAMKEAREYSNQVKKFREGEEASRQSYDEYKTYHDKLTRMEEITEEKNVIVTNPTFKERIANFLNSASAGLGILHDMGKTTAENTIDWVDQHQTGTAVGIGLIVGAAVIGLTIAAVGTVTLPLIGAAACVSLVAAGGISFVGTMSLNSYYGRDLSTNLLRNVLISGGVGFGASFLIGAIFGGLELAIPAIGNSVTAWCLNHQTACANIPNVITAFDVGEEMYLEIKLSIQTFFKDPAAGETLIELQLEKMDGGAPGNSALLEGFQFLKKNLPDAVQYVQKYGIEMIPFLVKYGDEGMAFLDELAEEGVEFIAKHFDDAQDAVSLAVEFGRPAMKLMDSVDVADARKLITALDADDIDVITNLSDDAIKAFADLDESILNELNGKFTVYSILGDDAVEYLVDGWTGTSGVWNTITATQPIYDGTVIPRSFEIVINDQKMWVHGNGTKHIYEEVAKQMNVSEIDPDYYSQILLYDFSEALNQATANGIKYEEIITVGNWEFIFSAPRGEGLLPVVKHAQFNGWGN